VSDCQWTYLYLGWAVRVRLVRQCTARTEAVLAHGGSFLINLAVQARWCTQL
jgi:hypothetical protein